MNDTVMATIREALLYMLNDGREIHLLYGRDRHNEIMARIDAALAALDELDKREAWEYVPDGPLDTLGTELHNRTIFQRCSVQQGMLHGYVLADGEYLVRRTQPAKGEQ